MDFGEGGSWSVFDGVKIIPETPEVLMAKTNAAIDAFEYSQATALLSASLPSHLDDGQCADARRSYPYDIQMADESFRAGCAALAARRLDDALHFLNVSLSKCPPHKTSAVAKLQSIISITSHHLHKSSN